MSDRVDRRKPARSSPLTGPQNLPGVKPELGFPGTKAFASTCAQTMANMIKDFRDQAEKAERLAKSVNDARTCEALLNYARECREKFQYQFGLGCASPSFVGEKHVTREPEPSRRPEPTRPTDPAPG